MLRCLQPCSLDRKSSKFKYTKDNCECQVLVFWEQLSRLNREGSWEYLTARSIFYKSDSQIIFFRRASRQSIPSCYMSQSSTGSFKEEVRTVKFAFSIRFPDGIHQFICVSWANLAFLSMQLVFQTSDGLVSKGITMSWLLTCWGQVLRTFSTFAAGNSHWRLFSCLQISWFVIYELAALS